MARAFFIVSIFLALHMQLLAGTGMVEHFNYDRTEVDNMMSKLDSLELLVMANKGSTYATVAKEHPALVADVSDMPIMATTDGDPALGIPSFLWGCLLGWIGILVVYLVTEDKEETKKALWGCIAGSVAGCVLYVVYVALIAGMFGGYYLWWF